MTKNVPRLSFALILLVVLAGCTSSVQNTPISTSSVAPSPSTVHMEAGSLQWMLFFTSPVSVTQLMYNHIPTLSTDMNQDIPSRQASQQEKVKWWTTFQGYILSGYSFQGITDIWGFDDVDLQGMLTVWNPQPMTILSGKLDTSAFRAKMKSYQYTEESYLGYTVLSGVPQFTIQTKPPLADLMPGAFGIIEGIKTNGDTISLILMADRSPENNISQAKDAVISALKAYQQKSSLGYQNEGITALASSLGQVGSAFITWDAGLKQNIQALAEQREASKEAATSVKLNPYSQLAITFCKNNNDPILEFVLVCDNATTAQTNIATLQRRLSEGQSITRKPLSELWTIQEVKATGTSLRATVKLSEQAGGKTLYFAGMIYIRDYLFLYPDG